jgi:hypothetical protein
MSRFWSNYCITRTVGRTILLCPAVSEKMCYLSSGLMRTVHSHWLLYPTSERQEQVVGLATELRAARFESLYSHEISIFSKTPHWLWGPPILLFNWYRSSFSDVKRRGVVLATEWYTSLSPDTFTYNNTILRYHSLIWTNSANTKVQLLRTLIVSTNLRSKILMYLIIHLCFIFSCLM